MSYGQEVTTHPIQCLEQRFWERLSFGEERHLYSAHASRMNRDSTFVRHSLQSFPLDDVAKFLLTVKIAPSFTVLCQRCGLDFLFAARARC